MKTWSYFLTIPKVNLHPDDFKSYGSLIREDYITDFKTKNQLILNVLVGQKIPVLIDDNSNVVEHNRAEKFPSEIATVLDNKKDVSKISIINRMRASSKNLEIPKTFTSPSTGMDFILIPAGEFMTGSPDYEVGRYVNEGKVREVIIKSPFNLGKHPVTQKQWVAIMGDNPSYFKDDEMPVENVSWNDVQRFIIKLRNC